ncbi:MAG: peptide-methionine (S)-S-oxide reductase [Parvicella sp.]|jgi:peptide-methionine (S)-S-oxide reductase
MNKIGFGGGCHWCTEGVFQSLIGVTDVQQGWIASIGDNSSFSEAVTLEFDPNIISQDALIEIHLYTHASTSNHSFRKKYRSAVYVFSDIQKMESEKIIENLQSDFDKEIITKVVLFNTFTLNKKEQLNYLYQRINTGFCERYIHPKLTLLMNKFADRVDPIQIGKLRDKNVDI